MAALLDLGRAALGSLPGVNRLPGLRKVSPSEFTGVRVTTAPTRVDAAHVARYAQVCGFPRKDTVPVTYPHLLTFAGQMEVMASPQFPWAAMGAVHVENTLTSHRPLRLDETVGVEVVAETTRPHPRGTVVDFVSTVTSGDEVVWESVSSYLVRGRGDEDAPRGLDLEGPDGRVTWRLDDNLGRRYARVSGDVNPIHLHPLTARALGFDRHIVHGMWTKARSLAAFENRLPHAVRVEVAFKRPVHLPSRVTFGLAGDPQEWRFAVRRPSDGAPHLLGRATPL